ncbi:MAG: heavy-metal-associated domain-containing protein [Cyanobacteriota bacterium]|nr:heavy-metal-associated domain-containing protein [Cyanobacteriota bacterium]
MTVPRRLLPVWALGLAAFTQAAAWAGSSLYRITVSGMVCSFCAQGIEKRVQAIPGTQSVRIDLSKGLVEVTARPGATIDADSLKRAIRDAGYDVRRVDGPLTSNAPAAKATVNPN